MTTEIQGVLKLVTEKQQVSDKFTKREIVIVTDTETQYPQPISIQLNQKLIDSIEQFQIGSFLKVSCNFRGREWFNASKNITQYFNTIEAWKIEKIEQSQPVQVSYDNGKITEVKEEVPF
jgi:hypothetical protein